MRFPLASRGKSPPPKLFLTPESLGPRGSRRRFRTGASLGNRRYDRTVPDSPFMSWAVSGRGRRIAIAAVALLAIGAGLVYLLFGRNPGDVSRGNEVEFTQTRPRPDPKPPPETFEWPFYGYQRDRTHFLNVRLGPPFKVAWKRDGGVLIEFPPVLARGVLYLEKNSGAVFAIRAQDGKGLWKTSVGGLAASSPAYADGRLYVVTLSGNVAALDARTGKKIWGWRASSRVESSPVVDDQGTVYFGSESGKVYAVNGQTGGVKWTYRAGGAVKAAPALAGGILYFGAYDGAMYAVRAADGKQVWSTRTSGRSFSRSGTFYSTPAVAFGRVYAGNTDGKMYSFSAQDGQLAWSHGTGAYVYSSPAVAAADGAKPAVYFGSYSGVFYSLDARTGAVRWTYRTGGKISGGATIVGNVVYFADLAHKHTIGLTVGTGKKVFGFRSGSFNPVISDGKRLYLTGYTGLWGLVPKR